MIRVLILFLYNKLLMIWNKESLIVVRDMFEVSHESYEVFIRKSISDSSQIMIFTPRVSIIKSDIHIILIII